MTVAEVSALHARYVRISDRLKAIWTAHQFVSGVYRHFLAEPVPYELDFNALYDRIKGIGGMMNVAEARAARAALDDAEIALIEASRKLILADERIGPSVLRRFFEKLKRQDDSIIGFLIRFYLYADAVEGDRRDKLDFLFTRLGEDFVPHRGEYVVRESLELRQRIIALVAALHTATPPQEEVVRLMRAVHSMRNDIQSAEKFDDLSERNLLKDARTFKHRVGDLYFYPDVLLAIIELNVATKNRFLRLYGTEEQRLMEDASKLLEHGQAIERNFGEANPALIEEISRFREVKERFDSGRAQSNVKHDVVSMLKASMANILSQLDRGLVVDDAEHIEPPAAFFDETRQSDALAAKFGRDEPLLEYLLRVSSALDYVDAEMMPDDLVQLPCARELRLEPWEGAAYQKLLGRRDAEAAEDNEDLWMLYLRAAALRMKVDEEATILATAMAASVKPEPELLARAKRSLDSAKELDEQFGDFLQEAVYYANRRILHQLYRSRFRLLRGFSGLWLVYDRQS